MSSSLVSINLQVIMVTMELGLFGVFYVTSSSTKDENKVTGERWILANKTRRSGPGYRRSPRICGQIEVSATEVDQYSTASALAFSLGG